MLTRNQKSEMDFPVGAPKGNTHTVTSDYGPPVL